MKLVTSKTRKALALMVAVLVGLLVATITPAAACHANVTAKIDCKRVVTFTATSWSKAADGLNDKVNIAYSTDNKATWTTVTSTNNVAYAFTKANNYEFTDKFALPANSTAKTVIVRAFGEKLWNGKDDNKEPRYSQTLTVPAPCGDTVAKAVGPNCQSQDIVVTLTNTTASNADYLFFLDGAAAPTNSKVTVAAGATKEVKFTITKSTKITVKVGDVVKEEGTFAPAKDCVKPAADIVGPTCDAKDAVVKLSNTGVQNAEFSIFLDGVLATTNGKVTVEPNKPQDIKFAVTKSTKITVKVGDVVKAEETVAPATGCAAPGATIERKCVAGSDTSWTVTLTNPTTTDSAVFTIKAGKFSKTVTLDKATAKDKPTIKTETFKLADLTGAKLGDNLEVLLGDKVLKTLKLEDCTQPTAPITRSECVAGKDITWKVAFTNPTTSKVSFLVKIGSDTKATVDVDAAGTKSVDYTLTSLSAKIGDKLEIFVGTKSLGSKVLEDCVEPSVSISQKCVVGSPTSWDVVFKNTSTTNSATFDLKVNGVAQSDLKVTIAAKGADVTKNYTLASLGAKAGDKLEIFIGTKSYGSVTLTECEAPGELSVDVAASCATDKQGIRIKFFNKTNSDATFKVTVDGTAVDYYGTNSVSVVKKSEIETLLQVAEDSSVKVVVTEDKTGFKKEQTVKLDCKNDETQVLAEQIERAQPVAVQPQQVLAHTGAETMPMVFLGMILVALGVGTLSLRLALIPRN